MNSMTSSQKLQRALNQRSPHIYIYIYSRLGLGSCQVGVAAVAKNKTSVFLGRGRIEQFIGCLWCICNFDHLINDVFDRH